MRKYELLRYKETILRVLEVEQDRVLMIDCIKQTMPVWVDRATADYTRQTTVVHIRPNRSS